ncbi:ABC transporter permease [Rhizosaccharibacter radicis]|uniref:ABC transporter permease n=1 Tax=Rhizosaccharibacter radicis TaxID=2782605 RepID=A0ABT1VZ87_9PROT|nr:ABC transporter permease [Acetobacteraceae bacterium KSS12]
MSGIVSGMPPGHASRPAEDRQPATTAPASPPGPAAPPPRRLGAAALRQNSVYIAFALLVAFDLLVTPGFRNPTVVRSLLFEAAPVILIALGQSLAIGTRGIDLSVGSVMALSSATIGLTMDLDQGLAIGAAVAVGLLCGILNGMLVAWLRIAPLISSLALLVAARGLAQAMLGGARVDMPFDGPLSTIGQLAPGGIPAVAMFSLLAALLFSFVVRRTVPGRYALFVGASRTAAVLAGHPVRATLGFVYGVSGLLAGIAGVFATARLGAADANYIGVQFELDAIAAAVIGGTPLSGGRISTLGTVFGVLLLVVLDASFIMNNVNANYAQMLKAAFIVGALFLRRGAA